MIGKSKITDRSVTESSGEKIGWNFLTYGGGTIDGPNDGAIDTFAGDRLPSLVREVIQNSLDAVKNKTDPVQLYFSIDSVNRSEFSGFHEIANTLKSCIQGYSGKQKDDKISFYENGIALLKKSDKVPVLSIHDANTTGLTGTTNVFSKDRVARRSSQWLALTKSEGVSQKNSASSLGSFGHGARASFAMSGLRMVYYYSKIHSENSNNIFEERFQGKCILESHVDPNGDEEKVGTGYYEKIKDKSPLINCDVQESAGWSKKLREKYIKDIGTSIYIPFPREVEEEDFEFNIASRVLANFFYAIQNKKLTVTIQGKKIDSQNLNEIFNEYYKKIKKNSNSTELQACFETIKTIINPTNTGEDPVPNFGIIKWYIRVDESCEKRVGVARSSGMLITHNPQNLQRFGPFNPFDFFVCVSDDNGSELLRSLENPQHNKFEFDRVGDSDKKINAEKIYKVFTDKVKQILKIYAAISIDQETDLVELADILGELSDSGNAGNNSERSTKLTLRKASPPRRPQRRLLVNPRPPKPTPPVPIKPAGGLWRTGESMQVQSFRFNPDDNDGTKANLFFTSQKPGIFDLEVSKVGEQKNDVVQIFMSGEFVDSIKIKMAKGERKNLPVIFSENVNQFVLEGKLFELEGDMT